MTPDPELFIGIPVRDDEPHWDALAARVADGARSASSAARFGQSRAAWIAAAILLIASLAYAAAPERDNAVAGADWAQALAPADDVGRAMTSAGAPPAIGALVLSETGGMR